MRTSATANSKDARRGEPRGPPDLPLHLTGGIKAATCQALLGVPDTPALGHGERRADVAGRPQGTGRLGVDRSRGYRLLEQASGGAVQSSRQWIFARNLIGVLAVIASAGCNQPVDSLQNENNSSMTREDVYRRQLDLDVTAIIRGMARAHGAQVVASTPEP